MNSNLTLYNNQEIIIDTFAQTLYHIVEEANNISLISEIAENLCSFPDLQILRNHIIFFLQKSYQHRQHKRLIREEQILDLSLKVVIHP